MKLDIDAVAKEIYKKKESGEIDTDHYRAEFSRQKREIEARYTACRSASLRGEAMRTRLAEKLPNCGWFDARAVAAVIEAHRRDPSIFR